MNGGFNPPDGFFGQEYYDKVVGTMRLSNDALWPMLITPDTFKEFAARIETAQDVAWRDQGGLIAASF